MKRILKISLILILFLSGLEVKAQTYPEIECGTQEILDPDFDPSDFEKWSIGFSFSKGTKSIQIPVSIRIVRFSDGQGGLDIEEVSGIMDSLNKRFLPADISFYQCGEPAYVDEGLFFNFDRSLYADSLITYNIPNVLNIYLINKILNDDTSLCGYASFPWTDGEYVVVKNECATNGSTLAHEVGHYLGLYHTHQVTDAVLETVDGSNCSFAGDQLCDTPADPRLSYGTVDSTCIYTGNDTDPNGQFYSPDVTNLMSYSRKECRDYFSPMQFERMLYYLEKDRSNLVCNTTTDIVDATLSSNISKLQIFPNPFLTEINISVQADRSEQINVRVSNVLGVQMHKTTWNLLWGNSIHRLDLQSFLPGIYFLHFEDGRSFQTHRIIKN